MPRWRRWPDEHPAGRPRPTWRRRTSACWRWAGARGRGAGQELAEAVPSRAGARVLDRLLPASVARDERRMRTSLKLSNLPPGRPGQLRLRFPAVHRAAADRDAGDMRLHPRHGDASGAGAAGGGQDAPVVALGSRPSRASACPSTGWTNCCTALRTRAAAGRLKRRSTFNVAYLVVDEVGIEPMGREDAGLFFRLVSYRYRRGAGRSRRTRASRTGRASWPGTRR